MVEKHFNNKIAPVPSRGGSLVCDISLNKRFQFGNEKSHLNYAYICDRVIFSNVFRNKSEWFGMSEINKVLFSLKDSRVAFHRSGVIGENNAYLLSTSRYIEYLEVPSIHRNFFLIVHSFYFLYWNCCVPS
jgi:hypothetical protein